MSLDYKRLEGKKQSIPQPEEMAGYRATKSGIARKIQKKLEQRYDEEDGLGTPDRIMEWMNASLQGEHDKCPGAAMPKLHLYLRDGVALCKFINKLRLAAGMDAVKYQKNSTTPFVARGNIEIFNKAAEEYGVKHEALFQTDDLYEGQKGPFLHVINCLNKLGFVSNKKGFEHKYESVEAEGRDPELWAST